MNASAFLSGLMLGLLTLAVPPVLFNVSPVAALDAWIEEAHRVDEPVFQVPGPAEARPASGYLPGDPFPTPLPLPTLVPYTAPSPSAPAPLTVAPPAAHCGPGQGPSFVLGFADLKRRLGATMGEPLECEHFNPANGDTLQQTTTGLAVYDPDAGELRFTDGWQHWALTPAGLLAWTGETRPAPPPMSSAPPGAGANPPQGWLPIRSTDRVA